MTRAVVASVLATLALSLTLPSAAAAKGRKRRGGALSQVLGAIRSKPAHSGGSRPQREVDKSSDSDDTYEYDEGEDIGEELVALSTAPVFAGGFLGVRAPRGQTDVDLRVDFQSVKNSDYALGSSARVSYDHFTLELGSSTFIETAADETLTLTSWRGTGGYRLVRWGLGEVTADLGIAGAVSRGLNLIGAVAGVGGRMAVGNALGVDGAIRGYAYTDGTSAIEAEAGVRLSVLRAGYRVTKFDVGPPLHGPQVGLALSF